jgi:hypothetical protein
MREFKKVSKGDPLEEGITHSLFIEATGSTSGRPLEPRTREHLNNKFNYDFTNVRVHDDDSAAKSTKTLGARAFTIKSDIFFGMGRYRPHTPEGYSLLEHELAHVVQQGRSSVRKGLMSSTGDADEKEAEQTASNDTGGNRANIGHAGAVPLIQRALNTLGGEWHADKYEPVMAGTTELGVEIDLKFTPKPPTESTKIGLIQKAGSVVFGSPKPPGTDPKSVATYESRSIPAGEPGAGARLDQFSSLGNPIYARDQSKAYSSAETLASAPLDVRYGQWGWRYKNSLGRTEEQDARLWDKPNLPTAPPNSSQTFETTAMAIEGPQSGTTYGSVQWGWERSILGMFSKLPLSIASVGIPTSTFRRAADLWNASKTEMGEDVVKLPAMRAARPIAGEEKDAIESALKSNDFATAYLVLNGQWMRPMLSTLASLQSWLPKLYLHLVLNEAVGISVPRVRSAIEAVQNKLTKIPLSQEFYNWMDPIKNPDVKADIEEIRSYLGTK